MSELRQYELMFVIRPDLKEEEINEAIDQVRAYMESNNCVVKRLDRWGMRKLAYEVKKFREGYYVLMIFDAEPQFIEPFKRWLVLNNALIRHLIVRSDIDPEKPIKIPFEILDRYEETPTQQTSSQPETKTEEVKGE